MNDAVTTSKKVGQRRRGGDPARRNEILEAALVLFNERGYDGTGIQDIAERVGMLKGSLYYHIESKEEILQELIRRVYEEGLAVLRAAVSAERDPSAALHRVIEDHTRFVLANTPGVSVALKELPALTPAYREGLDVLRSTYVAELRAVIADGVASASLRSTADPDVVVRAVIGTVNGACMWYMRERSEPPTDLPEQIADLLLEGLSSGGDAH